MKTLLDENRLVGEKGRIGNFFGSENIVSGVLPLAKPHRIKASHRRRWKGTTGHRVYIMNNPLAGTDPTGYLADGICLPGDVGCGGGNSRNDAGIANCKVCFGGGKDNGKDTAKAKGFFSGIVDSIKQKANDISTAVSNKIDAYSSEMQAEQRAKLAPTASSEGVMTPREAANSDLFSSGGVTPEKKALFRNIENGNVALKVGSKIAVDQVTDPVNIAVVLTGGAVEAIAVANKVKKVATAEVRAKEIHAVLDIRAQSARTTAVVETAEGIRVVSSSERRLSPAQRRMLGANEVEGIGVGHAETTGVAAAKSMGLTPTGAAASRPICSGCASALSNEGVSPLSPLKQPRN